MSGESAKARILFVDDEEDLREGLRTSLRRQRRVWHMDFADGGESALAKLAVEPYEIIVTDMRMPEMDGAELLRRVKDMHPEIVRIALTGGSSQEDALRVVGVAQQWLAKPCDRDKLIEAIERALALRGLLHNPRMIELVGSATTLPSPPHLYTAIRRALADPDHSLKHVTTLIECDPAMSTKLLQIVNSPYFGRSCATKSAADAVTYIGLERIARLALAIGVFEVLSPGKEVDKLEIADIQVHSLLTARIATRLAAEATDVASDEAYTAGMLHDVGVLLMAARAPEMLSEELKCAVAQHQSLPEIELAWNGSTHAELGGYLMASWGLPVSLVLAVAHHNEPARISEAFDLVGITHVASALAAELDASSQCSPAPSLDLTYLRGIGQEDRVDDWRAIAAQEAAMCAEEAKV